MTSETGELDFELMRRAQADEGSAMGVLHRKYMKQVYRAILREIRDPDDANDVLQEVFSRAWERRCTFRFEAPVLAWFCSIARNCCYDHQRKERPMLSLDDLDENDALGGLLQRQYPNPEDPAEAFRRTEFQRFVRAALEKLPELYRRPIELFYLSEKTYDEIALDLGINFQNVRGRLYRGRKLLKAVLEPIKDQL